MNSLKDEIKNAWTYKNAVVQLVIINIAVWLFMITLLILSTLFQTPDIFDLPYSYLSVPADFETFILRPWTAMTYAFMHSLSLWHILSNMLFLYWFGRLIQEYLGYKRVISMYVLGGLAGSAIYLIAYNFIPYYAEHKHLSTMVGASGAVVAIVVGAATLLPHYEFNLMFLGRIKIVYIAAFFVIVSYVSITGTNAGGNIAHLGGALMGYIFIKQLQKGNDWGVWVIKTIDFFKAIFKPKPKVRVSYRKEKTKAKTGSFSSTSSSSGYSSTASPSQEEIDAILDKIAQSGYESLSKAEKEKLFNASK